MILPRHKMNLGDALGHLQSKYCGKEYLWSLENNDYSTLEWDESNSIPKPTEEELIEEQERLQAQEDYQHPRREEYPSVKDQLDYIYHNGIAKWKSDMIKPVKDAHPKP